ncbi:MAG: PAS domain S-box protein [archaeon]
MHTYANFNFLAVNSAYAKGCGYEADELIGTSHFAIFPNEETKKYSRMSKRPANA